MLTGLEIHTLDDMRAAAQRIYQMGCKAVLVKGGGMLGQMRGVDIWFDGTRFQTLTAASVDTKNTHGTGCTLAAAIAANLALGKDLFPAVQQAKDYVTTALQHSLNIGSGSGPVGHFFRLLGNQLTVDS